MEAHSTFTLMLRWREDRLEKIAQYIFSLFPIHLKNEKPWGGGGGYIRFSKQDDSKFASNTDCERRKEYSGRVFKNISLTLTENLLS